MIRKLFFFSILVITSSIVSGQMYGNALGIRLGNDSDHRSLGLTYQQRIAKKLTVEGIFQSDFKQNTTFHGMIQKHEPLLSRRFNYYLGTGISLGSYYPATNISPSLQPVNSKASLGVDLLAGIELTMLKYTLSLDYKPNFNLVGRDNWYQGQVGLSLRAVILSGKEYEKKIKQREKEKKQKEREKKREEQKQRIKNIFNPEY